MNKKRISKKNNKNYFLKSRNFGTHNRKKLTRGFI